MDARTPPDVVAGDQPGNTIPQGASLAALFAAQVAAGPDLVALEFRGEELTYRELDQRSHRLACLLRAHGVVPGSMVGLCFERGLELPLAILAVVKAGAAYVPLDKDYPAERLRSMVEDSAMQVLLGGSRQISRLPQLDLEMLVFEELAEELVQVDLESLGDSLGGLMPAFVMFTSGSTGRPKGVVVPHQAICRLVLGKDFVDLRPGDVLTQISNPSFDAYTFELWGALLNGGRVLVIERETLLDPRAFAAALAGRDIAAMLITVALFNQMVLDEPRAFLRVRHLFFGGEACEPNIVRRALENKPAHLYNGYGPTECTTLATCYEVEGLAADATSVPIGKPITQTEALVFDRFGEQVEQGERGELYLGGEGLALGYWRRPALTAQAFVPHPSSSVPGARLYRTGDLARQLPSGDLDYLGRIDFQVKVRGFRIELGEIEAVLGRHPAVREKIALAQGQGRDQRLLAFVTVQRDDEGQSLVSAAELQRFCAETLAAFAVPRVHLLEALPLTPNGKINRAALPQLEAEAALHEEENAEGVPEPANETERQVAQAFGELLGLARVGREADFFALGGHSLMATRLIIRLRELSGAQVPVSSLFAAPTVAALAEVVAAEAQNAPEQKAWRETPAQDARLSFAQERLFFLHRFDPASAAYNLPAAWKIQGTLDREALRRALGSIEERQEVLRTHFREVAGIAYPVILPPAAFTLQVETLERRDLAARLRELAALSFDLLREKPWRVRLLELADGEHVLFLCVHHIAFDGLSLQLFEKELAAFYLAFCREEVPKLPPLLRSFRDHAEWQKHWLDDQELTRQLEFWRGRFQDESLELPCDRPRPPVQSFRGGSCEHPLDAELVGRVEELGRRHGATPFLSFLAPFQMLLARLSGRQRVNLGVPFAGRRGPEEEDLFGFFVNMLVLSADFSPAAGDTGFEQILPRLREDFAQAFAHQDLPFEKLVEGLGGPRDASRNPLFEVAFQLFDVAGQRSDFGGLQVEFLHLPAETARFDLELRLERLPGGTLRIFAQYAADLFDASTVAGWLELYEILLREIVAAPARPLAQLPLLRPADRALYAAVNDNATNFPREASLAEIFAEQAAAGPQRIALEMGERTLTYEELDRRSQGLARLLRSRGVLPGAMVGLCFERGLELPTAILAVVKAGAAYVPLDGEYPAARLRGMIEDTAIHILLGSRRQLSRLPELGIEVLALEDLEEEIARLAAESSPPLPTPLGGLAPAVTIFTSGSTGRPKGVVVTQRAICRLLIDTQYIDLRPDDVVVQVSAASFDVYTFEIWGALLLGGRLLVIDRETLLDPRAFAAAIAERDIAALFLTVALFNQMVLEEPQAFGRVRHLMFGGEACEPSIVRRALVHPPAHLQNGYGPAECTTYATTYEVLELAADAASVPIGKPVANTEVLVLDRWGQPASVGVHGELCLSGEGLALGYWRRPSLTAQAFVPHPSSSVPGARLYRTGDLARLLPSGDFDYLGRIDFQVKVRGYRIELGEVEAVLGRHPAVREKIALTQGRGPDQRLVAFVVVRREQEGAPRVTAAELQRFAAETLPAFAVPLVHLMDVLPLGPNGKVDRRALPTLTAEELQTSGTRITPRTELEEQVAAAFGEILGAKELGIEADFFALGGHSLLATRLIAEVHRRTGIEVPVQTLFKSPKVGDFAAAAAATAAASAQVEVAAQAPIEASTEKVLSYAQERLLFLHRLDPASAAYNLPAAYSLRGKLDRAALQRALEQIEDRQEVLRTRYREKEGVGWPEILPAGELELPHEVIALEQLDARLRELARQSFELRREKPWRVRLFELREDEHVLFINVHHIAFDGLSFALFEKELAAFYQAALDGRSAALEPLNLAYTGYARRQKEWLRAGELERQLAFWRGRIQADGLELPTDRPRPPLPTFRGGSLERTFDAALVSRLEEIGRQHGATPFLTFLAPFHMLLARLSGQSRINVGVPFAGRHGGGVDNLMGFFINTLVLAADLGDDPPLARLLPRLREEFAQVYAHQDVPFEKLVEELGESRDASRNPLFQVAFQLFEIPREPAAFGGLEVKVTFPAMEMAKFDLDILLERLPDGGLRANTYYAADLFEQATVAGWLELYEILLLEVAAAPELPLSRLPLLRPADRALYAAVNDNASDFPRETSLAEIFAAQVATGPERIALELRGQTMNYGELDLRSNQLAHLMRAHGVRPGSMVGLCFERGLELPLAILAVIKTGAAYVPLDGDYPEARLRAMAEDTALALLLASARQIARLPQLGVEMLAFEELEAELAACPSSALPFYPGGLAPAVTIFTSGSTGRPKGVVVTQRAICRLLIRTNYIDLQPEDVVVQVSAASFDVYTFEIWGAFLHGGRLLVIEREILLDPRAFAAAIAERDIAALFLTVALFTQMMLEEPQAFTRVRHLMFGGEACEPSIARRALAHRPAYLQNGYGPAECTTYATTYDVLTLEEDAPSVPIGKPVANTEVLVLDRWGQPASVGVYGELCLGGDGLALGYSRRPALTAQSFVPHPGSSLPGARLYRTGDLARLLPSGDFDYLGRIDFQVKVRGYRIELGEIEAVLGRHPAVREKIAITQGKGRDQRLIAFVSVRRDEGGEPLVAAAELQRFAAETLPAFAVPRVHLLEQMPLTPNGKIDRRALPLLGVEAGQDPATTELLTETERRVAKAFAAALAAGSAADQEEDDGEEAAGELGRDADFFALGGHSLLATRLIAKVREYCHVDVPLRFLFTAPTVSDFAAVVDRLRSEQIGASSALATADAGDPDGRGGDGSGGRISFAQQRLLFLHRFDPLSAVYNVPAAFTLRGPLDRAALQQALGQLEQRQEVLRTRFREEQGLGYFEVLPAGQFELQALPLHRQDLHKKLEQLAAQSFDLLHEKPWRVLLLELGQEENGEEEHVLLINVHHIAFDGLSLRILLEELAAFYRAACSGEEPRLAPLPWSFRDFAAWQRSWLHGEDLELQLAFWRSRLEAEPLELPTDRPRPPIAAFEGAGVSRLLDADLVQKLEELGRRQGASPFLTFLAPFQALLSRLAGQPRVNVGVPFSGRHGGETQNLIGFFINTLVLTADLGDDPSFEVLLGRLRKDFGLVYAHQDVPFEKLVEELGVHRDSSRNPLFQVAFQLFESDTAVVDFGPLAVEPRRVELPGAKFDLDVALERQAGGGLHIGAFYAKELFDPATVAGWLELYELLLRAVVLDPARPLSRVELLRPADQALYAAVNDNQTDFPRESNLLEIFAAQATAGPQRIAGEFRGATLTYGELDERSNRLARRLQQEGVRPGSMVGVCIERSLELVVAILSIVKTGSAYVPLDADYPAERLAGMVSDTQMPLLIAGASQLARLPEIGTLVLPLAQLEAEASSLPAQALPLGLAFAESAANVIFTSGSTGRPKGVVVTQRGVLRLVRETNYMNLQPGDVVVQVSSSSFDVFTFELWGALMNGGHLLVVDRDTLLHPKAFAAALAGRDVAALFLTVTLFGQMVHQEPKAFTGVRHLFFGGEACEPSIVRRALENAPGHLQNGYGPTECTCYATVYEVPEMAADARTVPIGKPVANTEVLVIDRWGQRASVGVHGELCLGGDGLAWGYWQRPALTAKTFVPHPSSREPGARLYRTGDLARLLPSGDFDYLGRIDFQVKVRGYRIELGEIEAVLGRHEAVLQKIALTRGQGADQLLVAFVVVQKNAAGEAAASATELQVYCAEHLPSFAVPLVRLLEVMPVTPNGKIDRRALPQHDLFADAENAPSEPPRDALERIVAEAWEEVLMVSLPGREADFFALGGHSLAAMRILSVLHENLGVELPLPLLFSHPILAEFAAAARQTLECSEEGLELLAALAELDAMGSPEQEDLASS